MMASRIVIVLSIILGISVPIQSQTSVDFGFSQSSFSGREQGESYKVQVKFFSGGGEITTGFIFFLSLDLSGTASSSDVSLTTTQGRFLPGDVDEPKDVEFSLIVDNIAQESNETFAIVLSTDHFSAGATIRDRLEVVIIDSDVITFQLSEVDYTQNEKEENEPNPTLEVLITKGSGIQLASPVYFRITPLTVGDALNRSVITDFEPENSLSPNRANYDDFDNTTLFAEFPIDEGRSNPVISVEVAIPIVDDNIDEADEQVFIIFLEVINATNFDNLNIPEDRKVSIGRIIDNEIIRIGFERPSYEVTEPNEAEELITNLVYLIREDNRKSEQTYSVDLTAGDPGGNIKSATIETSNTNNFDYSFGLLDQTTQNRLFAPEDDRIPFVFSVHPDTAVEGTETFRATSAPVTPSGNFSVFQAPRGITAFATTLINIIDSNELKVGFEELNYTVSESAGTVEVCVVVINPPPTADLGVDVTLSPSTIDGTAVAGSDFTQLTAFLSTPLEFLSSPGSPTAGPRRKCFNVTITGNDLVENTESFSLLLQEDIFGQQTGATINPNRTEIFILDEDEAVIGFRRESYSVSETDETVSIQFGVLTGSLGTTISVNLSLSDGTALSGSDYNSTEGVYSLTGRQIVTVDIGIIEDDKFERAEVFYANLSLDTVPPRVTLQPDRTQIIIIDPEALIFSFRAGAYSFMENIGTGTVYVDKINGSTGVNITLRVFGFLQAGQILDQTITFGPLDSEKAITFNIIDDNIALEPPEKFTLTLTAVTSGDGIILQPNNNTDITIFDDDELIIGFAENVSVSESENATLSITFSSAFATNFNINVGPSFNDSLLLPLVIAEPDEDYFLPDFTVEAISTLHNADNSLNFDVSIIQDEFLEYEECFVTAISLPDSVSGSLMVEIAGGKDTALVCIENDDRVTISFDRGMYSVGENDGSVQISASLVQGELQRPVEVLFSTQSGTATSEDPKDFQSLQNVALQFDELLIRNEVSVTIINDNIFEDEERFFASLVTNDADVDFGNNNATITIVDDGDVVRFGFGPVQYMVNEGAGSVTLFVLLLEGTLEREVSLQFSTVEGTAMASAPADYQPETRTITFSSSVSNVSVIVTIVDDSILESTENFLVNLADPQSQTGVSLMPSTANVDIMDNDAVNITFIGAPFEGREGSGFIAITVGVMEPDKLKTEVSVNLTTEDIVGISNAATAGVDYRPLDVTLTFSETATVITVNVTLLDDNALEGDEDFKAQLSTNSGSNVGLPDPDAIITIVDDDRVIIGFEEETVQVDESIGMKTLCVNVSLGQLERTTTVSVSSQDQTAINGQNYSFQQMTFTFSKDITQQCFDVGIFDDDDINELQRTFLVMLTTGDPQVDLLPDTATITIIDNDERRVEVNDTIIGDPLFTVPIFVDRDQREMLNMMKPQLCYEIHGDADQWFNLVTDSCTTVNALYTPLNDRLNVITKIGVKAVDDDNKCVEILVDRSQCSVSVDGTVLGMESYSSGNINVRRYSKRARISVPNCNDINLIMWVICEQRTLPNSNVAGDMLKFVVLRGLNYGRRAHGLLGQFWNVPVDITPYNGSLRDGTLATDRFNINVKGIGSSSPRSFTGWLYDLSWDHVEEPCLYVGNKQAGPIHEVVTPNDGVVENIFKDYKVANAFSEENYVFGLFNCPDVGSGLGQMQP